MLITNKISPKIRQNACESISFFQNCPPLSCGCGLYRPMRLKCWPWYKKGLICVCLSRIKYHWKHVRTHMSASNFQNVAGGGPPDPSLFGNFPRPPFQKILYPPLFCVLIHKIISTQYIVYMLTCINNYALGVLAFPYPKN